MKALTRKVFELGGFEIVRYRRPADTFQHLFQKYRGYTMVSESFYSLNLSLCEQFRHIPGDFVECGVWRGGMSAGIAEVLGPSRHMHLFDSFEGLPPAQPIDGERAIQWQQDTKSPTYYDNCSAPESFAREAMARSGHTRYTLYKGWFQKTLPTYSGRPIGILRLDGDWYDSIMVCLEHLFPYVSTEGLIILDDYETWQGCTRAVHDYLSKSGSISRIREWQNQLAYIVKA